MQSVPPQCTPATSPTTSHRWKRGRPVPARGSTTVLSAEDYNVKAHGAPEVSTRADRSQGGRPTDPRLHASTTGLIQRAGLWTSSQALRFAPTGSMEPLQSAQAEQQLQLEPDVRRDFVNSTDQISSDRSSDSTAIDGSDEDVLPEAETAVQQDGEERSKEPIVLSYQIPEHKLRAAMSASPNTHASFWSTKLYEGPEGKPLSIHYCKSFDVAERVARYFLKEQVLGFDIEWKPRGNIASIKQNASLIQLASADRIALFHVALFTGTTAAQLVPPSLKEVLESATIAKVGVAVKGDFKRLRKYLDIQAHGVFELSRLHNLVQWYEVDSSKVSHRLVSLAAQVLQHLQLPLYKGENLDDDLASTSSVRESDWSLPLDLQQIQYAAADAYAGLRLYDTLERKRLRMKPAPDAVQLCDYDSARAPKAKLSPKSTTVDKTPEDAGKTDMELTKSSLENEQEELDGNEGYETAPEEFMDSHELEEPSLVGPSSTDHATSSTNCSDTEYANVTTHKHIGRINLSSLRGPDPDYPSLPQDEHEISNKLLSGHAGHRSEAAGEALPKDMEADNHRLGSMDLHTAAEDDEYADVELEEALQALDLDSDGQLTPARIISDGCPAAADQTSFASGFESDEQIVLTAERGHETQVTPDERSAPVSDSFASSAEPASRSSAYDRATHWAQDYLITTVPSADSKSPSRIRATVPHLRAYHLWHAQKLTLEASAEYLRDPPLSLSTVTSYILQAITLERLEYDKEALKKVLLGMPAGLRGRWKRLAERVGV